MPLGQQLFAAFAAWRILSAVGTIIGLIVFNFLIIQMSPGNPVYALVGEFGGDTAYIETIRREFNLDKPILYQLSTYLGKTLNGDLGTSWSYGRRPVLDLIVERLPVTVLLAGTAIAFSTMVGVGLAVVSAKRKFQIFAKGWDVGLLVLYSIPVFWLAQILMLLLAVYAHWFPAQGLFSTRGGGGVIDLLHHLMLPMLAQSTFFTALIFRLTTSGLSEALRSDYVRAAKARGLRENAVLVRHALRNSMLPVLSVLGFYGGQIVAGAVLVEIVFGWPGIGALFVTALDSKDVPLLLGIFSLTATGVIVGNTVTDLLYSWIDPRIRYYGPSG